MVASTDTGAVWSALANGICTHQGPTAFLTYHSTVTWLAGTPSALASSFFGHEPWLTMDAVQSGHNIGHDTHVVTTPPAGSWVAMKNYGPVEIHVFPRSRTASHCSGEPLRGLMGNGGTPAWLGTALGMRCLRGQRDMCE